MSPDRAKPGRSTLRAWSAQQEGSPPRSSPAAHRGSGHGLGSRSRMVMALVELRAGRSPRRARGPSAPPAVPTSCGCGRARRPRRPAARGAAASRRPSRVLREVHARDAVARLAAVGDADVQQVRLRRRPVRGGHDVERTGRGRSIAPGGDAAHHVDRAVGGLLHPARAGIIGICGSSGSSPCSPAAMPAGWRRARPARGRCGGRSDHRRRAVPRQDLHLARSARSPGPRLRVEVEQRHLVDHSKRRARARADHPLRAGGRRAQPARLFRPCVFWG
jgi:hypothetical protein